MNSIQLKTLNEYLAQTIGPVLSADFVEMIDNGNVDRIESLGWGNLTALRHAIEDALSHPPFVEDEDIHGSLEEWKNHINQYLYE